MPRWKEDPPSYEELWGLVMCATSRISISTKAEGRAILAINNPSETEVRSRLKAMIDAEDGELDLGMISRRLKMWRIFQMARSNDGKVDAIVKKYIEIRSKYNI